MKTFVIGQMSCRSLSKRFAAKVLVEQEQISYIPSFKAGNLLSTGVQTTPDAPVQNPSFTPKIGQPSMIALALQQRGVPYMRYQSGEYSGRDRHRDGEEIHCLSSDQLGQLLANI
jgi:hypothetical protein